MEPALHLLIQYCNAKLPARQAEYDFCLRRNLQNPWIAKVHNLVEPTTVVPDEFKTHAKYVEHPLDHWMTYADALGFANENLAGESVCLANLDIFLDDKQTRWSDISKLLDANIVLCLSRFEYDGDNKAHLDPGFAQLAYANTQDAWIFRAPFSVPETDFEIGTLGCDNAFAERIRRAGRLPFNAPNRFRVFHFDRCRGKTFENQAEVHAADRADRPRKRPEEDGQYLVPDFDRVKSVDKLMESLKVPELQRYAIICEVMSRFIRIKNK
jgi:hypothetical protein